MNVYYYFHSKKKRVYCFIFACIGSLHDIAILAPNLSPDFSCLQLCILSTMEFINQLGTTTNEHNYIKLLQKLPTNHRGLSNLLLSSLSKLHYIIPKGLYF